jgi:hypothetical protein
MESIILPSSFDVQNVHYGVPKTNDNGGKSIYLSLNRTPIVLQTPEMYAPFGKQKWENDKGVPKFTLDLSFKGMETRDQLRVFFEKMSELDEKLVDDAHANSFEWLKKKGVSRDVVKELYTKLVRYPVDRATGEISSKYPPTFKLTLPFKDGAFQCKVFDSKRSELDLNTVETKGARVTAIIQCLGVWVAAGKFGCTWKVLQMRVAPPPSIQGYAFKEVENDIAEDDDDEEEEDKSVDADEVQQHAPVELAGHVKGGDEEDDDDVVDSSEDELEVKKPVAKVVKKAVASKKK